MSERLDVADVATDAEFEAAQYEHDRLREAARAHFESTGRELSEPHYMSCWCCCDDEPCASRVLTRNAREASDDPSQT